MEEVFGSKETAADLERARAEAKQDRAIKHDDSKDDNEYETEHIVR